MITDIDSAKRRVKDGLVEQNIIDPDMCIDIKSSNRYFNFWYGIVEIIGIGQYYGFFLDLDINTSPVTYRILGDIIGTYGESDDRVIKDKDKDKDKDKEEYIYERLSPGDVLILTKEEDSFLIAENDNGQLHIRRAKIEDKVK